MNQLKQKKSKILAAFFLLIIFFIDLIVPMGIAVGILYLFGFLLVCSQNKKMIITFALITSFLTLAKFFIFLSPGTNYMVYANRGITIILIWIITVLAIRHRILTEVINSERRVYINELEKMLFITSHKVRQPITNILGLANQLDSPPNSPEEIIKIIGYMKQSALSLENFTSELTSFIYDIKQNQKINTIS